MVQERGKSIIYILFINEGSAYGILLHRIELIFEERQRNDGKEKIVSVQFADDCSTGEWQAAKMYRQRFVSGTFV